MNTLKILENNDIIKKLLESQSKYKEDLSEKLYNEVLSFRENKFGDEFIKLVYDTLISWKMNQRRAKLSDFETFKTSILKNREIFDLLEQYTLPNIYNDEVVAIKLKELFSALQLTQSKTKFVTTAKTLHFFLPKLVVPMDTEYTLWFFESKTDKFKNCEEDSFIEKQKTCSQFSSKIDLSTSIDNGWNKNIPKIIDNLIIAIKDY